MKKKFLSFVFAILAIVPCCLALTACASEPKHTCEFETVWTTNETHHWHKCKDANCEKIEDNAEHAWNDGVITTPATSSANGVKTFTCTICEKTKTEEVEYVSTKTMTEEEWTKALTFDGINNFSMRNTSPDDADYLGLHIIDGNKLYYKQIGGFDDKSDMKWSEDYYEKVGDDADVKYYEYNRHSHNTNWTRREIDADYYNEMLPQNEFAFFQYNDFEYNETTDKYECENLDIGEGLSITGIVLAFENNRLVSATMTILGKTCNIAITYESTSLTIPTNFVNG